MSVGDSQQKRNDAGRRHYRVDMQNLIERPRSQLAYAQGKLQLDRLKLLKMPCERGIEHRPHAVVG